MRLAFDPACDAILADLVIELNKLRKTNKKHQFYRSKLGDSTAAFLHTKGVKTSDSAYNST